MSLSRAPAAGPPARGREGRARVVLADPNDGTRSALCRAFEAQGWAVVETSSQAGALELCGRHRPELLVIELRLEDGLCLSLISQLAATAGALVVVTGHGSVAAATAAIKRGAAAFLCKPATVGAILASVRGGAVECAASRPRPMTLSRARWEYLSRAVVSAGSISRASRALGLDARSLRRMLAKTAP